MTEVLTFTPTLAFELKIPKEKGCIIAFSDDFCSFTQEGERELKQLKDGETLSVMLSNLHDYFHPI
jgi:hypothetical protein